jgi:hypothetical protein
VGAWGGSRKCLEKRLPTRLWQRSGSPVSDDGRGLKHAESKAKIADGTVRPSVMTGAD